jgi:type IV secretory pathway TrbD component
MSTLGDRNDRAEGYSADIKRSLWERVQSFGVPRVWGTLWLCACLYGGLLTMTFLGMLWVIAPLVVWLIGHGVLVALTHFDPHWDDMALAHLRRRYAAQYDAG